MTGRIPPPPPIITFWYSQQGLVYFYVTTVNQIYYLRFNYSDRVGDCKTLHDCCGYCRLASSNINTSDYLALSRHQRYPKNHRLIIRYFLGGFAIVAFLYHSATTSQNRPKIQYGYGHLINYYVLRILYLCLCVSKFRHKNIKTKFLYCFGLLPRLGRFCGKINIIKTKVKNV